jgi:hypothetical protein
MTQTISSFDPTAILDFGHHDDRDLTRRIVGFLTAHGLLGGASLRLKVNVGHIELRGTVATFRQRDRIEAFIRRVAGVHHVTNQLAVGTPSHHFAHNSTPREFANLRGKPELATRFFQD